MLKSPRLSRSLAALPLLAALASAAPPVRWCPMPWSETSVEDFAACEARPAECARRCAGENVPAACGNAGGAPASPVPPAHDGGRAFCVEAPIAATQGPGSVALDPPATLAAVAPEAAELPEPARAASRPLAFEPARPHSRPPGPAPPVRGPPRVA